MTIYSLVTGITYKKAMV